MRQKFQLKVFGNRRTVSKASRSYFLKFEQRLRLFSLGNDKGGRTTLTVSVSGQCLCFMFRLRRVSVRVRVTNLVNCYLDFIRLRMLCSKSATNERMWSPFRTFSGAKTR